MSWLEEIAVVIPCLNEGKTIASLVREVCSYVPNVIVVDDGSTDATASDAQRSGATVLTHTASLGKGASLRTGFAHAFENGFSWALAMDGDGQHAPLDIPNFLEAAEGSAAAMFVGNRMGNARVMPLVRLAVNRMMSRALASFCRSEIPDSQCGFRLLDLRAWRTMPFSSDHFEIESELIVRFLHAGFHVEFVPVQTRYGAESSKIRPLKDTLRWLRWWVAIRNELSSDVTGSFHPRYESTPQDATA